LEEVRDLFRSPLTFLQPKMFLQNNIGEGEKARGDEINLVPAKAPNLVARIISRLLECSLQPRGNEIILVPLKALGKRTHKHTTHIHSKISLQ
jgi:hypothetical protein